MHFVVWIISLTLHVAVSQEHDSASIDQESPSLNETFSDAIFAAPPASCPSDTVVQLENGTAKVCQPGVITSCKSDAICYFDTVFNGYICCSKLLGYCPVGQPFVDPSTKLPKQCVVNQTDSCFAPFTCQSTDKTSREGFCCPDTLGMEPPPTGCPFGSRQMKNINGQELDCVPGAPNACPGNAICYTDTITQSNKCCGVDPGEGCPSGTKTVKNKGDNVQCVPGDRAQTCPGVSVCQWNYQTDRYQCCVTDNGCPSEMVPFIDANNKIQTCTQGTANTCQPNFSCEFNFWISSFQCCGKALGTCPAGQIAYLEPTTNLMRACYTYMSSSCTTGYSCVISSTNQPICCAPPGQPAAGYKFSLDGEGKLKSCLLTVPTSCTAPSVCISSVGGPPGAAVCSERISRCPNGKTAYPSESDPAVCMFNTNCPQGYTCDQPSSGGTNNICCGTPLLISSTLSPSTPPVAIQCPANFSPQSGVYVPCTPSWSNSCLKDASCQQSPNVPGIFLCCMPTTSPISQRQCTQSGLYYYPQSSTPQTCNPNYIFSGCPTTHSMCLNYPTLNGFFCCKVDICPNGGEPCWLLGSTIPQYCGGSLTACPSGYQCSFSNFFSSNICCKPKLFIAFDEGESHELENAKAHDAEFKQEQERMRDVVKLQSSSVFFAIDEPMHHKISG